MLSENQAGNEGKKISAEENLDRAYYALGREGGVTLEQIRDVLNAELEVSRTPFFRPSPFHNEAFIKKALKFHTEIGLAYASTFFLEEADRLRDEAYNQRVKESISDTDDELIRRIKACVSADRFLTSMSLGD